MGWDVLISHRQYNSSRDNIDEGPLPSFGLRIELIDKINRLFPGIEWENTQHGHLDNGDYFGNIDLGETEIMGGQIWLGIYGGSDPMKVIETICKEYNCTAFDTVTSEYIDFTQPEAKGWRKFLNFRNSIMENLLKTGNASNK